MPYKPTQTANLFLFLMKLPQSYFFSYELAIFLTYFEKNIKKRVTKIFFKTFVSKESSKFEGVTYF